MVNGQKLNYICLFGTDISAIVEQFRLSVFKLIEIDILGSFTLILYFMHLL